MASRVEKPDGKGAEVIMTFRFCVKGTREVVIGLVGYMDQYGDLNEQGELTIEQVEKAIVMLKEPKRC